MTKSNLGFLSDAVAKIVSRTSQWTMYTLKEKSSWGNAGAACADGNKIGFKGYFTSFYKSYRRGTINVESSVPLGCEAIYIQRNNSGHINFRNEPKFPWANAIQLKTGTLEVDPSRAGIGFCYSSQDKAIMEVTNNDDPSYHPVCETHHADFQ